MSVSGKLYGYIPLKGDGKNTEKCMTDIRFGKIKNEDREMKLREARYLDFMDEQKAIK